MMEAARRTLTFTSLDDVMPDVDRLLEGHTMVGRWSLAQICNHLTRSLRCTAEGFPERAPWLVRKTIGQLILGRILATGRFPAGIRLPKRYQPQTGGDARVEAEALRSA